MLKFNISTLELHLMCNCSSKGLVVFDIISYISIFSEGIMIEYGLLALQESLLESDMVTPQLSLGLLSLPSLSLSLRLSQSLIYSCDLTSKFGPNSQQFLVFNIISLYLDTDLSIEARTGDQPPLVSHLLVLQDETQRQESTTALENLVDKRNKNKIDLSQKVK